MKLHISCWKRFMVLELVLFRVLLEGTGTNFNGSSDGKSAAGWFYSLRRKYGKYCVALLGEDGIVI